MISAEREIIVKNVLEDQETVLTFNERLVNVSFKNGYLLAATTVGIRIYKVTNLKNFVNVEVNDTVSLILQNVKNFYFLTPSSGLHIYNYEGKQLSRPNLPGIKCNFLN